MLSVWGMGPGCAGYLENPSHFCLVSSSPIVGGKKKMERESEKSFCNILTIAFDSGRSLIAPNRCSDPA